MLRQLLRQKGGLIGIFLAGLVIASAVFAPWIAPHDPYLVNMDDALKSPSWTHPLGTDLFGRDVMSRLVYGARMSMQVSVASRLISLLLGVFLGLIAGYFGGRMDSAIMRFADVTLAYPALLLLIAVVAAVGPSPLSLILALGVVGWAAVARVVRAQVLSIKEREFVVAVRSMGGRAPAILVRHLLPNCFSQIIVIFSMGLGMGIMAESSMSFLGLGAQPPLASWGSMISDGIDYVRTAPWLSLSPGIGITAAVLGFNLLGDAVRDVLDPKLRLGR